MGKKHTFSWIDAHSEYIDGKPEEGCYGAKRDFPTKADFLKHCLKESDYLRNALLDANIAPGCEGDPIFSKLLTLVKDGYIRGAVGFNEAGDPAFGWKPEPKPGRGHVHCWTIDYTKWRRKVMEMETAYEEADYHSAARLREPLFEPELVARPQEQLALGEA